MLSCLSDTCDLYWNMLCFIFSYPLLVQEVYASANSQVHTLRRMVREKDQTIRRQSRLERQAQEAQQAGGPGAPQPQRGEGDGGVADSASPSPPPCPNLSPRWDVTENNPLSNKQHTDTVTDWLVYITLHLTAKEQIIPSDMGH